MQRAGRQDADRLAGHVGIALRPRAVSWMAPVSSTRVMAWLRSAFALSAGFDHRLPEAPGFFVGAGMRQNDRAGSSWLRGNRRRRSCPSAPGGRNSRARHRPAGKRCRDFRHRRGSARRLRPDAVGKHRAGFRRGGEQRGGLGRRPPACNASSRRRQIVARISCITSPSAMMSPRRRTGYRAR